MLIKLFLLSIYANLGAEPGQLVMYTPVALQ